MVKKFDIPPAVSKSDAKTINISVTPESSEEDTVKAFRALVEQGGWHTKVYANTVQKFADFLDRNLQVLPDAVGGIDPKTGEYISPYQVAYTNAQFTGILYTGKRLGDLHWKDEGDSDITNVAISHFLGKLSELVGEKQATVIFQKLQSIVDAEIKKHTGPSKT